MLDIRSCGAIGDGRTVNTSSIQQAIDRCSAEGLETVLVAGGRFVTGTLFLKDNVRLHVAAGAELLGSTDLADYHPDVHHNLYKNEPNLDRCLIFARGATGIGLEGRGVINGQGIKANFPSDPGRYRPMLIRFLECSRIRVRDITLLNPACWTSAWIYCDDIVVDGVTIHSRVNENGDGLDFDGCRDVRVSNCSFDTSDDSICLQTSRADRPCRDVVITNCIFSSRWAGIRIGLLSRGDFERVTVSNCIFRNISDSGLKIQMCEGGRMHHLHFADLVMEDVPRPLFITLCQQRAYVDSPDELPPLGRMGDLSFSAITINNSACGSDSALIMVGSPIQPIEGIRLRNIRFLTGGGCEISPRSDRFPQLTPEALKGWWPEYYVFGMTVPAHGIYAEHVQDLSIEDCQIDTAAPDCRPALVCHDVSGPSGSQLRFPADAITGKPR